MNLSKTTVWFALAVLTLTVALPSKAAQLSGRFQNAPGTYNLTSGSADWVHFGFIPIELDRKRDVPQQISDYTPLNGADPGSTTRMNTSYSWNDGLSPAENVSGTVSGKRVFYLTKGFRFTVPAKTSQRTLRVYVGSWSSQARFTARLSDGSAPAYSTVIDSANGYSGRVITLNFRGASNNATLLVDYIVTRRNRTGSFITLESAALNAAGKQGGPLLTGANTGSPTSINLSAVGPTDWVHWGRISDQPTDRKAAVARKISGHATIGSDVSPSPGPAGSGATWTDGSPNPVVAATRSGIRVFDINKGIKTTVAAGTRTQTVKAYVGLAGAATGQFRASLSDGSAAPYVRNVTNTGGGRRTYEFTVTYAAGGANRELTLAWVRTNPRSRGGFAAFESVKLLGQPEPDSGGPGVPSPLPLPTPTPPPPPPSSGTATLGNYVWVDSNNDGLQSSGETGLSGVTVSLRACGGATVLATTTTDGSGNYLFTDLATGRYDLTVTIPAGFAATTRRVGAKRWRDSDAFANGSLGCARAAAGKAILSWDAGLTQTDGGGNSGGEPDPGPGDSSGLPHLVTVGAGSTRLGNKVWSDTNGNGVQDAGEPGVANVVVDLRACSNDASIAQAATNTKGIYLFARVPAGPYYLNFTAPNARSFTAQSQGGSTTNDSDVDSNGNTRCLNIGSGQSRFTLDAGLR